MKVKGSHTTTTDVEVDISPSDAFKALKKLILDAYGFPYDACVNSKGQIVVDVEYYTSHSWFEEKIINPNPTNEQLKVFEDIKNFAQQLDLARQMERKA
jgi:hypothetical protein